MTTQVSATLPEATETAQAADISDVNKLVTVELEKLGEKFGEFKPYDSQLPIADIAGSRVVKCLYQVNKKLGGKKVAENSYVRR